MSRTCQRAAPSIGFGARVSVETDELRRELSAPRAVAPQAPPCPAQRALPGGALQ
jgi:hypothetical protein